MPSGARQTKGCIVKVRMIEGEKSGTIVDLDINIATYFLAARLAEAIEPVAIEPEPAPEPEPEIEIAAEPDLEPKPKAKRKYSRRS